MPRPGRLLVVFLDGVGIGPADPDRNPFLRADLTAWRTLGGAGTAFPTLGDPRAASATGAIFPVDATLGVPGLPQSGTGHATLLTGQNGAQALGRHFGPWVPVRLRPVVSEESFLRRAVRAGREVVFANAYPRGWPGPRGTRGIAGPPLAARAAGLLTRHEEALAAGEAVASEIHNEGWRTRLGHAHLPRPRPEDAGRTLARLAASADLTFYAHYTTDVVGHRGSMAEAVAALERVDRLLAGITAELDPGCALLVVSDHGNIEDVEAGHTTHPALGMAAGPGWEAIADEVRALTDVAGAVLRHLGVERAPGAGVRAGPLPP